MALFNKKSSKNIFKFNLIPPPTKEEIVKENTKTKSFLYTMILVIGAVLAVLAVSILDTVFFQSRINRLEDDIAGLDLQIKSKDEIKKLHGEFITKSNLLEPVLELDIKLTDYFDIVDEIDENSEVRSHHRESDGRFLVVFALDSISEANKITENAKSHERIRDFNISGLTIEESETGNDKLIFTVSFRILA